MKKNNNSGSRLTDGKNSNYYLNSKSIYAVGSSSLLNEDIRKKKKARFDFLLPAAVLAISVFGVFIIYSATRYSMPNNVTDPMYYFKRQGFWLIGAFVVFIAFQFINYRFISRFSWAVFIVIILLLIWVLVFGYEVNNSKSWVDLKFFSVQPSEFAKILMVIVTASVLSRWPREKTNSVGFKKVAISLTGAAICILLVILEPDYGTSLIFYITYMGMLFMSGANLLYFFGILIITAAGFFGAVKLEIIKQYQLDRILVFIKPDIQKQGIGYNLFQSKLAIGSGGIWGKGLFLGKQTNLSYVPAHHTDFIFSVIGEEIGFFGSVIVIAVLAFIIWRCFYVAQNSGNSFGSLIAGGIGFIILSQTVINIGMTIGIMPIIGIPLPFLSYGGSNLLAIFIGIALVENVYFRRELRKSHEIAYDDFD